METKVVDYFGHAKARVESGEKGLYIWKALRRIGEWGVVTGGERAQEAFSQLRKDNPKAIIRCIQWWAQESPIPAVAYLVWTDPNQPSPF